MHGYDIPNAKGGFSFWPRTQDIQLGFVDDAVAERIASANADRLLKKE